ncbi:hypothetical protein D9M71_680860 [compost metagenome]
MVDQRRAAEIVERNHLAEHDPVVAAIHHLPLLALEARRAVGEQRRTALADLVIDTGELVFPRPGEVIGQVDLVGGKDVHREMAGLAEYLVAAGALVDAPENQRRVQRYGVETVGRHAGLGAGSAGGSDDGDAGGEVAQRATEVAWVEARLSGHCQVPGVAAGARDSLVGDKGGNGGLP